MPKIKFAIVSKDKSFMLCHNCIDDFYTKWPEYYGNVDFTFISDNSDTLPTVYNRILAEVRLSKSYDIVVFMHADVWVLLSSLIEHIRACLDKYDVMGLCGCARFSASESPLNWFCGSRQFPESRWGCVTHRQLGNNMSFFSGHSPTVTDHSVACIDGLCIIFGPKALESNIQFDNIFAFDFYDTDLSFQCLLQYKLKLGVLVEKSLVHQSVGMSITRDDFLMHELDFRKKWNLDIPVNSRLSTLVKSN